MSSSSDQVATEEPASSPDKPWAELNLRERAGVVVEVVLAGGLVLGAIGFVVAGTVISTLQLFEARPPSRHCEVERSHCLTTIPARVRFADALSFTTSADRPPYIRQVYLPEGPTPAPGTRVTLEEWKGHVISFVDPKRGRRHTVDWPNHDDDVGTAIVFNVFFWGGVALLVTAWLAVRSNERAAAARTGVSERHAQTS